jgi:hypothetical protein
LKLLPGDEDALRCKAVLLIEAGNHEEALRLVSVPPLAAGMAFEKVSCRRVSPASIGFAAAMCSPLKVALMRRMGCTRWVGRRHTVSTDWAGCKKRWRR